MNGNEIKNIVQKQRDFFYSNQTKNIKFRIDQLTKLKKAIHKNELAILDALKKDLNRSEKDAYLSEIYPLLNGIKYMQKHIKKFARPIKVKTPFIYKGSSAYIKPEPHGLVLIVGTWNYPFDLTFHPLIGAIAAGNCAIIKPSEIAPASSSIIHSIIKETFVEEYIAVIEGGIDEASSLLEQQFDYIFFTGSQKVGSIVMQAAAKKLTPVTLELGGKSPCIVDETVDIPTASQKIVWGKFFNAGQTCIAPDYIIVHQTVKAKLIEHMKKTIKDFYQEKPIQNQEYGKIINEQHLVRLKKLLENQTIIEGGTVNEDAMKIAPTLVDNVSWDNVLMQDEIFGPILPMIEYKDPQDMIKTINQQPKALTIYLFSKNKDFQNHVVNQTSSGSICLNDTMIHFTIPELPFGGVGASGMGKYHGKASFDTFSHKKSIFSSSNIFKRLISWRYPNNKVPLKILRFVLGLF